MHSPINLVHFIVQNMRINLIFDQPFKHEGLVSPTISWLYVPPPLPPSSLALVITLFLTLSLIRSSRMANSVTTEHPVKAFGWAARDQSGILSPFDFSRRDTGELDVRIKVLYCGVCHSDLHNIRNEWGSSTYPLVPGHEMAGEVTEVGSKVTKVKVGDKVGVGVIVNSDLTCKFCEKNLENYCPNFIQPYNSIDFDGTRTYGAYSDHMVVPEHYVIHFPDNFPLDAGCPLLCAGITGYSAMKYYKLAKPGEHLGIVGLGGLGHVAVKFAKVFGAKVTVISHTPSKQQDALERLGADSFLLLLDKDQMQAAEGTFDSILDTGSSVHPIGELLDLLKTQGKLILVGEPKRPHMVPIHPLIEGRKTIAGSVIGGIKETQEMICFAAEHGIAADIELISMDYVNTAMERLAKEDVKYRFVIDVGKSFATKK